MNRPISKEWLEPFRLNAEMGALDYEAAFVPPLPRRTALNRLNRLREAGLVDRHGETRSTIYQLTRLGRTKLEAGQTPQLPDTVAEIIRARCTRREAVARLRRWAEESIIESDRKRFVAAAEETLAGIHEGNFARYRVRPSEFEAWKAAWR
ncbi:MAG: hypothetical protein EHM17_03990 [Verrucomicrobiaceae bacterium]|jgi:hypothetical protein|nr:MAG: hypothetical protein EHM17_03990 [Verrucomicrobiaceae bacterium]